jgi:hypothetical protein
MDEAAVGAALALRIAGTPADGSVAGAHGVRSAGRVVWVQDGCEALVHIDSLAVRIVGQTLLVSLDLETDQFGRSSLVVPLALGGRGDPAGLVAVTEELPLGAGALAACWGHAIQAAVWSSLLTLARDHASGRGQAPRGIAAEHGELHLRAGPLLRAAQS